MKLLGEKVTHIKYGTGIIMEEQEDGRLEISFSGEDGSKVFHYPEAFERFLRFKREDLQECANENLIELEEQKEAEAEQERARQAKMERYKKQFMEQFIRNQRTQARK